MKILFDHQIFQYQRIGGVSRYFAEIMTYLSSTQDVDLSIEYTFNEYLKSTNFSYQWCDEMLNEVFPKHRFRGQKRLLAFLEKNLPQKYPNRYQANINKTVEKLKEGDFDIFHPTFFDDYYLEHMNGKPYVLTVHDMILELYPEFLYSPNFIKRKRKLVDNAAHIIAVSNNTKADLIDVFGVDPDKISVIYHSSSLSEGKSSIELPPKYLFFVGDRRVSYKNFLFFLSSLLPLLHEDRNLHIVTTGSDYTSTELNHFHDLGIEKQMKNIYVADTDLYTCYNKAQMLVFPSYYEGFGIPIVEAFQADCPVVLADASCFPEIAGDAALYFAPKSPSQMQKQIKSLLENPLLREEMIKKGRTQLTKYSWEKSAEQTLNVYENILHKS